MRRTNRLTATQPDGQAHRHPQHAAAKNASPPTGDRATDTYLAAVASTLSEWDSAADEEAFRNL